MSEAGGPGALHPVRLNLGGTGSSAAAPANPQPRSTPKVLDPYFRASKPRRVRPFHRRPHSHGCCPVPSGSGQERRRRVRRALTGKSHGRQCPDLPRLQPKSPPRCPETPIRGVRARAPRPRGGQSQRCAGVTCRSAARSPPFSAGGNVSARRHMFSQCSGRLVFSAWKVVVVGVTFLMNS